MTSTHTIVHIGAGQGCELEHYLSISVENIVLVEPQPGLAENLRKIAAQSHGKVSVIEAAITGTDGAQTLKRFNLRELSSLYEPSALLELFPGLQLECELDVKTMTLAELLEQTSIPEVEHAALVIDAPGAELAILSCFLDEPQENLFAEIQVFSPESAQFSSGSNSKDIIRLLEDKGYDLGNPDRTDPDRPCWRFSYNRLHADLQRAQEDNQDLNKRLEGLALELTEEKRAHIETSKELENNQHWLANRKRQVHELNRELEAAQTSIAELKTSESHLEQARKNQTRQLSSLDVRLAQLFNQQSKQLQETANALGRHVTRSTGQQRQQLESALGLQGYFETGGVPLTFGGWAISADLATRLVKAVEQNNFDLIIEFGSGTSTVLLAKAVANTTGFQAEGAGQADLKTNGAHSASNRERSSNRHDLPQSILSFEQDPSYHRETWFQLQQHGLASLVDLLHAPLVPARYKSDEIGTGEILFYDCDLKLRQIAQHFQGRQARILVLVDGPFNPQRETPARAPALGALLQYLSEHQLHCVLDDTLRDSERQAAEIWTNICQENGLNIHQTSWHTENGATYFIVNPD